MILKGFKKDEHTGVYIPTKDGTPAGYLDGAEKYLSQALTQCGDLSVYSLELRSIIRDWPSQYHLSPYRVTIMDCLEFDHPDARVLELGAGCGAITRWLGENFGDVAAVEGDRQRATVARLRCSDLSNIEVYSSNYHELVIRETFDITTLIGVLEYSHMYHPEHREDPVAAAVSTLILAHKSLKDTGVLILAIENKYGLKYFSGAREDHSGRLFDSIQGYPQLDSAVTFCASRLKDMLLKAGFCGADFFLPFPDYKLATDVINLSELSGDYFLHNWIQTPFPDRATAHRMVFFNESLAVRELFNDGMIGDLANSFLVLAYKNDKSEALSHLGAKEQLWVAKRYVLNRNPLFCKKVSLLKKTDGEFVVEHGPVFNTPNTGAISKATFTHKFATESFIKGELVIYRVFEILTDADFKPGLKKLLAEVNNYLIAEFSCREENDAGIQLLRGESLDALFWNIVEDDKGEWRFIDREWGFTEKLPVDYMLWRNLYQLTERYAVYFPNKYFETVSVKEFIIEYVCDLYPSFDTARYSRAEQFEKAFQLFVDKGEAQPVSIR